MAVLVFPKPVKTRALGGLFPHPEARDEYDGYVNAVLSLLRSEATETEIVDYLVEVGTNGMGLERERASSEEAVRLLLRWHVLVSR